jgi:hypothetical protein
MLLNAVVLLVVPFTNGCASSVVATVPTSASMRDALEPSKVSGLSAVREDGLGKEVRVTLRNGDRMEGPVRRIDAGGLRLDRSLRTIPLHNLQRNVRRKPVRGSVDSAAIGLVAGAAAGFLAGYATYDSSSPIASSAGGEGAAVAATFGVLEFQIGGLVGWLTTHERTYEI